MTKETFKFRINGAEMQTRMSMKAIVDYCREKAINGRIVLLEALSKKGWVRLATYGPDSTSPIQYTHKGLDGKPITEDVPCCIVNLQPLAD